VREGEIEIFEINKSFFEHFIKLLLSHQLHISLVKQQR